MILDKLRKHLKKSSYEAILLSGLENPVASKNLKYVTNYTGSFGFSIITENKQFFLSDFRYREQAQSECIGFTFVEIEGPYIYALKKILEDEKITKLGFDKKVRYSEFEMYQDFNVELIPMDNVIESFRLSKEDYEIELIQKACEITDEALGYVLKLDLIGKKEKEVEAILKSKMLELGAQGTWERFIVASGKRGAMPHGSASEKVIVNNELITFDIGCIYKGYTSDLTRTIALGEVDEELLKIYDIVYHAQAKAVRMAKAGMTGKELDSICRDYITEAGYGEYFKHGTGHGIGLDVHEEPRVSQANDKPLELGAAITIEPGIYITGLGGVRIEDDLILTKDGCIVLNKFPKELIKL